MELTPCPLAEDGCSLFLLEAKNSGIFQELQQRREKWEERGSWMGGNIWGLLNCWEHLERGNEDFPGKEKEGEQQWESENPEEASR